MIKLIGIIALTAFTTTSNSQFFKKLGDRVVKSAEDATIRKTDRETEKKTDKALDKVFNPNLGKRKKQKEQEEEEMEKTLEMERRSQQPESNIEEKDLSDEEIQKKTEDDMMKSLGGLFGGGGKKVTYDKSYTFDFTANMKIVSYGRKNDTSLMTQSYGKKGMLAIMEDKNSTTILTDWDNSTCIMLDDKKKTGQAMSMEWMSKMAKSEKKEDEKPADVKKTGKTKTINGYLCYEYIITTEDTKLIAWFAPDVNFSYQDYLQGISKMVGQNDVNAITDNGYAMEMTTFVKGKKQSYMKVISIKEETQNKDLNEFEIQTLF